MRLLELRNKKNITQKEIAEKLFLTQNGYSSYENGRTEPNIETLCKLADFYDVSLDYLVGRERNNDIGYLNDRQISAIKLLKLLNEENLIQEIGRLNLLIELQQ